jgi:hypothetical protein
MLSLPEEDRGMTVLNDPSAPTFISEGMNASTSTRGISYLFTDAGGGGVDAGVTAASSINQSRKLGTCAAVAMTLYRNFSIYHNINIFESNFEGQNHVSDVFDSL